MTLISRLGGAAIATLFICASAQAGQFTIESGKTKPLRLKSAATSIVVGNPNVADVAVHDEKLLFISGKTFGTTNLMIFDKAGNTIYSADIVVTTNTANLVTVNRAGEDYSYDCAPTCQPSLAIGDSSGHFDEVYNQTLRQQNLSE